LQCREPPAGHEVQIPYFGVQIPDFSAAATDVALGRVDRRRNDDSTDE
jgi:hypothetical protein